MNKFKHTTDIGLLRRADQLAHQQFVAFSAVWRTHPSDPHYKTHLKAEVVLWKEWKLLLKEVYNNRHHQTWARLQKNFPSEDLERYNPATY